MKKTLIKDGSLVSATGISRADILISVTGEIEELRPGLPSVKNADVIDARGMLIFPMMIDCHVHFREPGLTHKATMESEAEAALAGGIGSVCEMPNTSPPTTSIEALSDKVHRAASVENLEFKFFFGITEPGHLSQLKKLWSATTLELKLLKSHCCGIKLYLDHSTGDQRIDSGILDEVFKTCAELNIPLVAHCEDPELNAQAKKNFTGKDISGHSVMRPPESEKRAIETALSLCAKHKTPLHIAHLSTSYGADLVRSAKSDGLKVTSEVAPHHLFLTTDDYEEKGTLIKVNPPVRSREHRDALWQAVLDGTVDCIASDHAPHTLEEKKNPEPLKAPSGIPGTELVVPLLLSAAAGIWPHPKSAPPPDFKIRYEDIFNLCYLTPKRIFGLNAPEIKKKSPARLALIAPEKEWIVTPSSLKGKSRWTPYEAWTLKGKVEKIILF